jgi:hypothetical protein
LSRTVLEDEGASDALLDQEASAFGEVFDARVALLTQIAAADVANGSGQAHTASMARPTEEQLLELRLRYQSAYTAYQSCVDALTEVSIRGERPDPELLRQEAQALRELNEARAAYRDAILRVAFGPSGASG